MKYKVIIFTSLNFSAILKILNIIEFKIIFKILYHYKMFNIDLINDKLFNFIFLSLKIISN